MPRSSLVFLTLAVTAFSFAYDPDDYKDPPKIDATYIVHADMRSFRGFVQVLDPNDITRRQYDEKLLIEAEASYLCQAIDEPIMIPEADRATISHALITNSPQVEESIMNGPMLGWFTAFIVLNREKEPTALVMQQLNTYFTTHIQHVSGSDTFQSIGQWGAYSVCPELDKLIGMSKAPTPERETPFRKWVKEAKK